MLNWFRAVLPREERFFDLFARHNKVVIQGAHALQAAGYATDPKYAQKLVGMIQQFKNMGEKVVKAYSKDLNDLF